MNMVACDFIFGCTARCRGIAVMGHFVVQIPPEVTPVTDMLTKVVMPLRDVARRIEVLFSWIIIFVL